MSWKFPNGSFITWPYFSCWWVEGYKAALPLLSKGLFKSSPGFQVGSMRDMIAPPLDRIPYDTGTFGLSKPSFVVATLSRSLSRPQAWRSERSSCPISRVKLISRWREAGRTDEPSGGKNHLVTILLWMTLDTWVKNWRWWSILRKRINIYTNFANENVVGQATLKHYFTTAQKFGAKVRDVLVTWVLISALLWSLNNGHQWWLLRGWTRFERSRGETNTN